MGLPQLKIRSVALREGLLMVGNHSIPAGKRHWRADASSFALIDYAGHPYVWIEGGRGAQVVGDMAVTTPKPQFAGATAPEVGPRSNEVLTRFEVLIMGGVPVIRTWWAVGTDLTRTAKNARLEYLDEKTLPERCKQLAALLNWKG